MVLSKLPQGIFYFREGHLAAFCPVFQKNGAHVVGCQPAGASVIFIQSKNKRKRHPNPFSYKLLNFQLDARKAA